LDYNQQRRNRSGGYSYNRQMNYQRKMATNRGCDNVSTVVDTNSGCQQEWKTVPVKVSQDKDHGCQAERNTCGCDHKKCTYMRQKGCLEDSAYYSVGMSYTPWQSWGCTYDGHRALMSGTIFPELDKPFCATGRCGR